MADLLFFKISMENINALAIAVAALVSLISYMWVRLQRQLDKQQLTIQEHATALTKLDQQKNGDYKLLNEKISQQTLQITEIKGDMKDLTKSIHELIGKHSMNPNT